jgi:hypothetical protein
MRIQAAVVLVLLHFGTQACTHAVDSTQPRDGPGARAASAACDPKRDPLCKPLTEQREAVKPAVPPMPDSPIKAKCEQLPTQVERDTCANRKESTG